MPQKASVVKQMSSRTAGSRSVMSAHGSGVYATDTVDTNLAGHFLREGYTVWLLDNRMSNRLGYARDAHTMDDIAHTDIPAAIDRVHAQAGDQPIDVFAHCVGGCPPGGCQHRRLVDSLEPEAAGVAR